MCSPDYRHRSRTTAGSGSRSARCGPRTACSWACSTTTRPGRKRCTAAGGGFDGVLLVPAFLEAGRLTAADIHWARVGPELVPVGETEFARDPAFGYTASDLRDFVTEKSGGAIGRGDVATISLADIRLGGPS